MKFKIQFGNHFQEMYDRGDAKARESFSLLKKQLAQVYLDFQEFHDDFPLKIKINAPVFITIGSLKKVIYSAIQTQEDVDFYPYFYGNFCDEELPVCVCLGTKSNKNIKHKLVTGAFCCVSNYNSLNLAKLPTVDVIVRFHKCNAIAKLERAICSLSAMNNCRITVILAMQDCDNINLVRIKHALSYYRHILRIREFNFYSKKLKGDLRNVLLIESLRQTTSDYVAFLDYDDLLFPNAYTYLIDRIEKTGKSVSFGRVYETTFFNDRIKNRTRSFEDVVNYKTFFYKSNIPLHSYLLRRSNFNFDNIKYNADQIFMEDYYLNLQLFNDKNCDWVGLKNNIYIGDYIKYDDSSNTLAVKTDLKKEISKSIIFKRDADYITHLKSEIKKGSSIKQYILFAARNFLKHIGLLEFARTCRGVLKKLEKNIKLLTK